MILLLRCAVFNSFTEYTNLPRIIIIITYFVHIKSQQNNYRWKNEWLNFAQSGSAIFSFIHFFVNAYRCRWLENDELECAFAALLVCHKCVTRTCILSRYKNRHNGKLMRWFCQPYTALSALSTCACCALCARRARLFSANDSRPFLPKCYFLFGWDSNWNVIGNEKHIIDHSFVIKMWMTLEK